MKKLILMTLTLALTVCCAFALSACTGNTECEHEFGDWNKEIAATCDTNGTLGHKTCVKCYRNFDNEGKELQSLVITAPGVSHTYKDQYDVTCEVCGAINAVTMITPGENNIVIRFENGKTISIPINTEYKCTHEDEDAVFHVLTAHTIDTDGVYLRECKAEDCKARLSIVSKTEHDWSEEIVVEDGKNLCVDGATKIETCGVCGKIVETPIEATAAEGDDGAHTVAEDGWTVESEPVHITPGRKSGTCTVCNKTVYAEIPGAHEYIYELVLTPDANAIVSAANRDEVVFNLIGRCKYDGCDDTTTEEKMATELKKMESVDPNCISYGYDTYGYFTDDVLKASVEVTIATTTHVHTWENADGEEQKFYFEINMEYNDADCPDIAEKAESEINCKEHVPSALVCDICNEEVHIYAITDHVYPDESTWITIGQDCENDGTTTKICKNCLHEESFTAPAYGHRYDYQLTVSEGVCTVVASDCKNNCGIEFTPVVLAEEDVETAPDTATCTAEGEIIYSCTYESVSLITSVATPKLPHKLNGNDMDTATVYVWDDVPGLKTFNNTTLSCGSTSDVYFTCDSCNGKVFVNARATHADNTSWTVSTPATCTANGIKTGYCRNCGTDNCEVIISSLGHSYSYTYNEEDATVTVDCSRCNDNDYTINEVTIDTAACVEATCSTMGKIVYVGKDENGKDVTVTVSTPKTAHEMPGEANADGAYLYVEGETVLSSGETISNGETKKAIYVCPVCQDELLIVVYLPEAAPAVPDDDTLTN